MEFLKWLSVVFLGKCLFYVYVRNVCVLLSNAPVFHVCLSGIGDSHSWIFYFYCFPGILSITKRGVLTFVTIISGFSIIAFIYELILYVWGSVFRFMYVSNCYNFQLCLYFSILKSVSSSWSMPAILALRMLRQEDKKFLASLGCTERPLPQTKRVYLNIFRSTFSQILYYPCE